MGKYRPEAVGRRVIALREKSPEEVGGILIPEQAREQQKEAIVFDVGPDCQQIKKGDRILIPYQTGTDFTLNGMEAVVILEEDVQIRLAEEDE